MSGTSEQPQAEQSMAASISNLVVGMLHTYTGRGPTRAWTSIEVDLVSVVLRNTLSKGERTLVGERRAQLVLDTRQAYQQAMRV